MMMKPMQWPSLRGATPVIWVNEMMPGLMMLGTAHRRGDDAQQNDHPLGDYYLHHASDDGQAHQRPRPPISVQNFRECHHIHRHSRVRGNDGNRRLETDILRLTTLPNQLEEITSV